MDWMLTESLNRYMYLKSHSMQDVITADGRGGECSVMFLMIEPTTYHSNGGDLVGAGGDLGGDPVGAGGDLGGDPVGAGGDLVGAGGNLPVLLASARVEDL